MPFDFVCGAERPPPYHLSAWNGGPVAHDSQFTQVASLIHRLMANARPQIIPPGAGDT